MLSVRAIGCYHGFAVRSGEYVLQFRQTIHQTCNFLLNFRNVLVGQDQATTGFRSELGNEIQVVLFDSPLLTTGSDVFS